MSAPTAGRSGPPVFAVAAFWAFVFGGVAFGVMFVANWRVLAARAIERPGPPSGVVNVGRGPTAVTVPVAINPGPISMPVKPADVSTSLASAVKTVLPDWTGTDRVNILV